MALLLNLILYLSKVYKSKSIDVRTKTRTFLEYSSDSDQS